jgi:hypothetical protein
VDAASLILIATGLLALLGAAAVNLGTESRDGFGPDAQPRDLSPRLR